MTEFNFTEEMVFKKKHLDILNFKKEDCKLYKLVEDLFGYELSQSHNNSEEKYELFTELGKDSHTVYHRKFYDRINNGWPEFTDEYTRFIKETILPYMGLKEALYQQYPNFRIHLPNNRAIVVKHYDSDEKHRHPPGEVNFVYALTDMFDTNSIYTETMPRSGEYTNIKLEQGQCICFNGNLCSHYNDINVTGQTRVSFDFRILPLNLYKPEYGKDSVTKHIKYVEGGYYRRIKTDQEVFKGRDAWDKEKEKFNNVLVKYKVPDAWGVVDIFEKKMAEYAGSRYAVSVDNCTNALFLCLKFLKAEGSISIPARTWISVPNTILNAGCKVTFDNRDWSGMYQLKPYPIYDGAVRMKRGMYKKETLHCLSFHIRKHIPIGKGGMILTDDKKAYDWLRTVRYVGRTMSDDGVNYKMYSDDEIKERGWNMYMTPEQAARGLELLEKIADDNPDQESSGSCKDLSLLNIF